MLALCGDKYNGLILTQQSISKGEYKGCPCVPDPEEFFQLYFEEWDEIENMLNAITENLQVECDPQGDPTGLPESLFRGGLYEKYCEELAKDMGRGLTWVVDHEGNQIPDKVRRDGSPEPSHPRALRPRSPPVKADDYEGYVIELMWEPTEDGGACPETCKDSLLRVSNSQCKSTTTVSRESMGEIVHLGRRVRRVPHDSRHRVRLCDHFRLLTDYHI